MGLPVMQPALLVLAAGMGSRYGGLKQLDGFGPSGETLIDYSVYDAVRAGFGKAVFVIRESFADAFRQTVGERYANHIDVEYVYQEPDRLPPGFSMPPGRIKPWGTGHAILLARDVLHEPFAVINGDDYYGPQGLRACAAFLGSSSAHAAARFCMVGYRLANTLSPSGSVSRGLCERSSDDSLKRVTEMHHIRAEGGRVLAADPDDPNSAVELSSDSIVSMNLWGFTPAVFDHLEQQFVTFLQRRAEEPDSEFYIPAVVDRMIRKQQATAHVLTCNAQWFGVTYRQDKPYVEQNIQALVSNGSYPTPLWSGNGSSGMDD